MMNPVRRYESYTLAYFIRENDARELLVLEVTPYFQQIFYHTSYKEGNYIETKQGIAKEQLAFLESFKT